MQSYDESDYKKLSELLEEFLEEYSKKDDAMSDEEFLRKMFEKNLPGTSADKIDKICKEILNNDKSLEKFLNEARTSPGYENATQNWFCEKINRSLDDSDYDFVQRLCSANEILDIFNQSSIQLSKDLQKLDFQRKGGDTGESSTGAVTTKGSHAEKTNTPTSANVRRASLDASVKKSILNQYKRVMNLDFASMNLRTDISNIATNLSRNAALTGICGMALTTGLSMILKGSTKQSLTKFVVKAGMNDSLRVIVTGALKVGAERRLLPLLTRATPMITLTAVALIAIESSKTMIQYMNGEIKCLEALNQVSKISTSAICSVTLGIEGAIIGTATFAALPIASPLVGAFMGELVGTMAGYEVGRVVHTKFKAFLTNMQNVLSANYGIVDMLIGDTIKLTSKKRTKIKV